jgi:FtsP/CotA-like multicopper oxidase with cupredoxin domain
MPRAAAYNMSPTPRSKKMASWSLVRPRPAGWTLPAKNGRINRMVEWNFRTNRRGVLAAFGTAALAPLVPCSARTQGLQTLSLQATTKMVALRAGEAKGPTWSLVGPTPAGVRFDAGSQIEISLQNELPVPIALNWRGLDGVPAAEPLTAQAPVPPGGKTILRAALRRAGTSVCDVRLLGDGASLPSRPLPVVIEEGARVPVDRDQVLLVEDFRLRADGSAVTPGLDPGEATTIHTVNGQISPDILVRSNERLRIRLINAAQRQIIAVKIDGLDVRVMAVDGVPAEPFLARNGALVLPPGGRADAFIDATIPPGSAATVLLHDGKQAHSIAKLVASAEPPLRPAPLPEPPSLPPSDLPAKLDLRSAVRFDLALGGPEWMRPRDFAVSAPPAFTARQSRVVVLTLTNRSDRAAVFHLHGHHFRLLDRLDDGWKPYWLDTLAIEPAQTQRVAFPADHSGPWLLESAIADWSAPTLLRWYSVE